MIVPFIFCLPSLFLVVIMLRGDEACQTSEKMSKDLSLMVQVKKKKKEKKNTYCLKQYLALYIHEI